MPTISAPTTVALRSTSAFDITRARIRNSSLCSRCDSPSRSVPKPIFTPALWKISSDRSPASRTWAIFATLSGSKPSRSPSAASAS